MKSFTKQIIMISVLSLFVTLSGCDNSINGEVLSGQQLLSCDLPLVPNSAGTECVEPPPLDCPPPTVPNDTNDQCVIGADPNAPAPIVFAGENEAILFYNRANQGATNEENDPSYEGYRLHTWNNEVCDAYADSALAESWSNGLVHTGVDPNYGAYWILELKDGYGDCGNFIIHIGTDEAGKELGGGDWTMNLVQDDPDFVRMNWTISQYPSVFEYPITSLGEQPLQIEDNAAHWIDVNTIVWNHGSSDIASVKLHHSPDASIEVDENDNVSGSALDLSEVSLTTEQQAWAPQVASWPAYAGDWTADDAKNVLKNQLVAVGYDASGQAIAATYVQTAKALDAIYTVGDNDANEATLGPVYDGNAISVSVWAPTAQQVNLVLYSDDKIRQSSVGMSEDSTTGIWSYTGDASLDRVFYRFEITVYHPQNDAIEMIEVTDPYSVSLSTNGEHSQFVNLADADLLPEGWADHLVPTISDPEDAVIYEGHIRDFSARDESVSMANRGKYLAFTETGSLPVSHLTDLASAGITHFHMLPVNDIASINERDNTIVDMNDTVEHLCLVNRNASVCGKEDEAAIIGELFASYEPGSSDAQALANDMRGFDEFNWGYDPKHFNVPDGIYASDPDGVARIKEFRSMVKSLHEMGLRVVVDVVYNHTNSAGLWDNSVLDKVVPGYYHSRDIVSGSVLQSTCCNDTALEHTMMDKLMSDSLMLWTEQYGIDGYRFDIMSHGSKQQMLAARDRVRTADADTYFYGEGWPRDDRGFESADQFNMAGTEIATFNDRQRDAIRNGALYHAEGNPDLNAQDILRLGMTGQLANYVLKGNTGVFGTGSSYNPASYALDPADVINYVSKHDNPTLWDQLQFVLPFEMPLDERVRIANMSAALPLMSQGIPFLQLGGEMLRSKSLDQNSYDAGDWFNYVDFTMTTNNWDVGLPLAQDNEWRWDTIRGLAASPLTRVSPADIQNAHAIFKEFLQIRSGSKLFRLTTEQDIIDRVGFHNIGNGQTHGLVVMSIDDGTGLTDIDPNYDAIVVVVNGSAFEQSHTVSTATGFTLHPIHQNSSDSATASASFSEGTDEGTFTVPARTMAVFVKAQSGAQGDGLSAYATSGYPDVVPYGPTTVYIRGGMNGWSTDDAMDYKGNGIYRVAIDLVGGTNYEFKFASEDWSTVNYGNSDGSVTEGADKALVYNAGNLSFTPSANGSYFFEIDASVPESPVLNIRNTDVYAGTAIYVRGGINGWGTGSELVHMGDGIYKVIINVGTNTGVQEFKVASADWSTIDLSTGDGDATVTEDVAKLLGPGAGAGNMNMDFAVSGEYTFILDASHRTLRYLSVHETQMYGSEAIYLRGSLNGWGTDDELVYQGDSIYQVDKVLTAGDYEFKFADANWSSINYGANGDDQAIVIGEPKLLFFNASNIQITIPADGNYRFTVTGPNEEEPTMTVTAL